MRKLGERRKTQLRVTTVVLLLALGLFCTADAGWCVSPQEMPSPENLDFVIREMFPPESIMPPYKIELWVASTGGKGREGAKTLIRDCLAHDLKGLAETEPVNFVSSENALLRIRVWFTQSEGPEGGECYDTTFAVVVSKINRRQPASEVVLDAYSVAGKYEEQLYQMCGKVALRLDLKILSVLRSMRSGALRK